MEETAYIDASGTTFSNNGAHIAIISSGGAANSSYIVYNTFGNIINMPVPGAYLWPTPSVSGGSSKMIALQNINPFPSAGAGAQLTINYNTFTGNLNSGCNQGINAIEAYNVVYPYALTFTNHDLFDNNTFNGYFNDGIYMQACGTFFSENCTFDDNITNCIYLDGTSPYYISSSPYYLMDFSNYCFGCYSSPPNYPVNGAILNQCQGTVFDGSSYQYLTTGLQNYGTTASGTFPNVTSDSHFKHCTYGIMIAPDHYPITASGAAAPSPNPNNSTDSIYLQIQCNGIGDEVVGIAGCGNLMTQYEPGNLFGYSGYHANSAWDILWQYGGTHPHYYYDVTLNVPDATTSNPTYDVNFTAITTTADMDIHVANGAAPCLNGISLKKSPTSIDNKLETDTMAKVYPSPFSTGFSIDLPGNKGDKYGIIITDVLGKNLVKQTTTGRQNIEINAQNWSKGIYLVKIRDNAGQVYSTKLIKE